MCEPTSTTALAITIGSAVLSTTTGIMNQVMQSKAERASAKYNAQVAENQASTERTLAQNEIQKGVADRERQQRNAMRQMGAMRAGMGASGFEMDSGTNLSLLEESATEHQYDSNIIDQNAKMSAWQHLVGATSAENSARFYQYQSQGNKAGELIGIGGSLLGGIGTALDKVNKAKSAKGSTQSSAGFFSNELSNFGAKAPWD